MAEISTPLYPDTLFVDEYIRTEREAQLARAVIAVDHFSGGNPVARDWVAAIGSLELSSSVHDDGQEQERITEAVSNVEGMLRGGFIEVLASESMDLLPGYEEHPDLDQKISGLMAAWERLKVPSPLVAGYRIGRQVPQGESEELPSKQLRQITKSDPANARAYDVFRRARMRFAHTLLYIDTLRLDPAHDNGGADFAPPESMFREAVFNDNTVCGVTALDFVFESIQSIVVFSGTYAAGRSEVKKSWQYWHPKETFFPDELEQEQRKDGYGMTILLNKLTDKIFWNADKRELEAAGAADPTDIDA